MEDLYQEELNKLLEESKDKDNNWLGWYKIERIEDILIRIKYSKIS